MFIKENKHLPGIPSANKMEKEGLNVSELNMLLLQKIEELTLYIIQFKKENTELIEKTEKIDILFERLELLEKEIAK